MKPSCLFDGCDKRARGLGYCPGHYRQHRHGQELRPLRPQMKNQGKECSGPECSKPASSSGLCSGHKSQRDRGGALYPLGSRSTGPGRMYEGVQCSFEGCERGAYALGLCGSHHGQHTRGGPLRPLGYRAPRPVKECSVEDCRDAAKRGGMCDPHYRQNLRNGTTGPRRRPTGRYVDPESGYASIKRPGHPEARGRGGWGAEHRIVMSDHVGRALFPDETVHHRNGVRDDNRIENLELWSKSHPPGQRVADKLAWAREILVRYESAPADVIA